MTAERRTQNPHTGKHGALTDHNAALKGASMAFGKPPIKPKPQVNTYSGKNGALAAATSVGSPRPITKPRDFSTTSLAVSGSGEHLPYQRSGGSNSGGSYMSDLDYRTSRTNNGPGLLQPQDHSKSPSFIAATLAASRSVTPNHTGQSQQQQPPIVLRHRSSPKRRHSPGSLRSMSSMGSLDQPLDTTSIAPIHSLIGVFEQNLAPRSAQLSGPQRKALNVPERAANKPAKPLNSRSETSYLPAEEVRNLGTLSPRNPQAYSDQASAASKGSAPSLPSRRNQQVANVHMTKPRDPSNQEQIAVASVLGTNPIPILSKTQEQSTNMTGDDTSSDDSFVSATDYEPSFRSSIHKQNRQLNSNLSVSNNSSAAVDSLATAIVASSLASSRAPSPPRTSLLSPPQPPPSRRHHLFHNSGSEVSRTPSPGKTIELRTTMRKPKENDHDDGDRKRRGRKNLMKKHPNKHHEGDRKRWRDEVTERERKRYEAVWASNRGLYTSPGFDDAVSSLVARDIYSRSRLHEDVLEEVYSLIDREKIGMLQKEEFVIGLWLIDQRLKGRKLPIRVTESVWRSVGILRGIKVRKAGK